MLLTILQVPHGYVFSAKNPEQSSCEIHDETEGIRSASCTKGNALLKKKKLKLVFGLDSKVGKVPSCSKQRKNSVKN